MGNNAAEFETVFAFAEQAGGQRDPNSLAGLRDCRQAASAPNFYLVRTPERNPITGKVKTLDFDVKG